MTRESLEYRMVESLLRFSIVVPVGSYPTPFLGYILFYIGDPNHKTRYPKKGGYEPLGNVEFGVYKREYFILMQMDS